MNIEETKNTIKKFVGEYEKGFIIDPKMYGRDLLTALNDVMIRIDRKYESDTKNNYDYPVNLLFDIGLDISVSITDDMIAGLDYCLESLTGRERELIVKYYGGKTYVELGREYCLTRERIRQIINKALRKLRYPARLKIMETGLEATNERKRKKAELDEEYQAIRNEISKLQNDRALITKIMQMRDSLEKVEPEEIKRFCEIAEDNKSKWDISIYDLELSVRAYNCLHRVGIKTLGDLSELTKEKLMKIRNMGRKSADEIIQKMKLYGVNLREE